MNLTQLNDVAITNPQNNQQLQYDTSTSKWKNSTIQSVSQLSALTDVSISNVSNNQAIIYDSTAQKYENKTIDHVNLANKGTNTHTQIDSHISSSSNIHGVTGSIVGTSDTQTLTNKIIESDTNYVSAKALHSHNKNIVLDDTPPTLFNKCC